ncbi:putative protein kinase CAMK-CAMKL-CHK1 family [Helianthus annuus]|uniref:non-specific serine/threonine protein kinase n=2 Tax=Helianthus annuus TaxID=4232 RepID=A0A251SEE7_HELAN|nr:uncharacterized protein LOC110908315 isoform X1 [Helianthus annuus]KAF5768080.1 putative protein kinase CAMK-CAMKL-CHK1 family [Helianthus annuus]KAJ0467513.1 putative protein kinase CAMK-CAMKL-CHK1 family [Helianthus annuus]KAJ0484882.1 putative protein kinase CAMK-CAMKL-CHK1 family [Helianthus annuus]KAJ0655432.1 putative protein kinase CAMK-CAMKL-CHK1 family [Helianthus annuus]KAJ0839402.1 putative protein kinase CAMK-CAMKL-CHK1 family [Helianthus annuus]
MAPFLTNYQLGKTLGIGTLGKVKIAKHTETGETVAIKIYNKRKAVNLDMLQQIKMEIATMKLLKHPNVVRLYEVIGTPSDIYVILEYLRGGNLSDKIVEHGRMNEDEARYYFQQLINAVDYCHSRGIYHRDLKPKNLLLDASGNLKVTDFVWSALAQQVEADGLLHTKCGTTNYAAPEVLSDKGYDGAAADLWSCGVILFELLAGYMPFDDSNRMNLLGRIKAAEFTCPSWLSLDTKRLIHRLLDPDRSTRITLPELLNDEWFKKDFKQPEFLEKEETNFDDVEAAFQVSEEEVGASLLAHKAALQFLEGIQNYRLEEILSATNNFSDGNLITEGRLGKVYKGQHLQYGNLVNFSVRRLDRNYGQGDEFETEISMLKSLQHKNIVSFFWLFDEDNEKIIIYKQSVHGTLDQHLNDPTLTWSQRLQICLGVANALNYIHYDLIHCDISSSKIFLDNNWEPKMYGFELSTKYPQSWRHRLLFFRYFGNINMTPKYDVCSFGVLLFEVLCGRKPTITNDGVQDELDKIINPDLRKQMDPQSLELFTDITYKCLNQQLVQRPTMDHIVKELEEVLELQLKHANLEHSIAADGGTSSNNSKIEFLKIPLREIRRATNDFDEAGSVGCGGYGIVYKAKLDVLDIQSLSSLEGKCKDELRKINKTVAIKRIFSREDEQGKQGFLTEIELLTSCKHSNIVSLLGFSREAREMILVYEYAFKGSLSDYLGSNSKTVTLTWAQRLQICLDIAHGINYLHTNTEGKPRIIHRDIKSENILLDENLNAKIADFGLSKFHPMKQQASTIYTKNIAGTEVYMDPEYLTTFKYKKESDIYSFGVVLFEVLSGRMAYDPIYLGEYDMGLAPIARRRFNEGTLKELIDPKMLEGDDDHIFTLNRGPNQDSLDTYSKIAYQCLAETQGKRPTMEVIIKELQNALNLQGDTMELSRFELSDIVLATENFAETYCIGVDSNGMVYKAELEHFGNDSSLETQGKDNGEPSKKRITVAIKRITSRKGVQGKEGFFSELEMRARYKHPNIVSLLGFCDEGDEMILVYEHASEGSLGDCLKNVSNMNNLTWTHRLQLCLEIARGLDHLHTKMDILHGDISSPNILLDKNKAAKIAYFGISKLHPTNQEAGVKVFRDPEYETTDPGYETWDPEYETTGELKRESDVFSFGVVLFEIFSWKLAYDPGYVVVNDKRLARQSINIDGMIQRLIDPKLKEETDKITSNGGPDKGSLYAFFKVACRCVGEASQLPMATVIKELERALHLHNKSTNPDENKE